MKIRLKPNLLFSLLVLLELSMIIYLIGEPRLVLHDSFLNFAFQYYCLNNVVWTGEFPQWIPYLTHGVSSYYAYAIQGMNEVFVHVLFLAGGLLQKMNFLPIYYLSLFVDEMVLLVGMWLWSKHLYSSRVTAFFVSTSVLASSIWMSQVLFNFHFFYMLPLIFYWCHEFFKTGRWQYVFFAFNLFILQSLDKVAYFVPMVSLIIALYLIFYISCHAQECRALREKLDWGGPFILCVIACGASGFLLYSLLKMAVDEPLVHFLLNRDDHGLVPLNVYLAYGVRAKAFVFQWVQLLLGFSPYRDCALYIGILPLWCLAFVPLNQKSRPIIYVAVILFLISIGSFVATVFYYLWPLMKYYRHLGLLAPVLNVFLCFLAGFGFEEFFFKDSDQTKTRGKHKVHVMTFIFLAIALGLALAWFDKHSLAQLFITMGFHQFPEQEPELSMFIQDLAGPVLIAVIKISLVAVALFGLTWMRSGRRMAALTVVLIFHIMDVYSYSFVETKKRTVALDAEQYELLNFQPIIYHPRRTPLFLTGDTRERILSQDVVMKSALNWTVNAFLFKDQVGTDWPAEYWSDSLNQLLNAYPNQDGQTKNSENLLSQRKKLDFPLSQRSARVFSGVDKDKIQFFSKAYIMAEDSSIARFLADPEFKGDMLFLTQTIGPPDDRSAPESLTLNYREEIAYAVKYFDSNHIVIMANVPGPAPTWMLYSDTWHKGWEATVNGKPVPVWRANLAYKAVQLEPGANVVHFKFFSKIFSFLIFMVSINALAWVGYIVFQMIGFMGK